MERNNRFTNFSNKEFSSEDIFCQKGEDGELGAGAKGLVRVCYHKDHSYIAAKCFVVHGGRVEKENTIYRIQEEYDKLKNASHGNCIVQVYGYAQWPYSMGLLMEYMPGGSLWNAIMNPRMSLGPKLILRMAQEVSKALAYIHGSSGGVRLVHGDIKPENILLSEDLHCKLSDFGSACFSQVTGAITVEIPKNHNSTGGTRLYKAPELLQNPNSVPVKEHDTYSFGLVIYCLLSKGPPCVNKDDLSSIDAKVEQLNECDRKIFEVLKEWMVKCWDHDPRRRPSMTDVRDALYKSLSKQSTADIQIDVTKAVLGLPKIKLDVSEKEKWTTLNNFNTKDGSFSNKNSSSTSNKKRSNQCKSSNKKDKSKTPTQVQGSDSCGEILFSEETKPSCSLDSSTVTLLPSTDVAETRPKQVVSASSKSKKTPNKDKNTTSNHSSYETMSPISPQRMATLTLNQLFVDGGMPESTEAKAYEEKFCTALKEGKYKIATKAVDDLYVFLRLNCSTKPSLLKGFAKRNKNEGRLLEALLFYDLAQRYFEHKSNHQKTYTGLEMYFLEVSNLCTAIMNKDSIYRDIIGRYVIPRMRRLRIDLQNLPPIAGQTRAIDEAKCLQFISTTEKLVGESKQAKGHLQEAMNLVKKQFNAEHPTYVSLSEELSRLE